jgi:hypothetical protein
MILNRFNAWCELQGHNIYCAHTYWRNKTGREKDDFYDFVLVDTLNTHKVIVIRVSYEWDKSVDYMKTIAKYTMFFTRVYKDKNGKLYYKGLGNKIYFNEDLALEYKDFTSFSKSLFED